MNRSFANAGTSPLTKEDLEVFKTLDFFEINANYKIKAAFELTPNSPLFEMPTTTERVPLYRTYGIARFTLNGLPVKLNIYQESTPKLSYENHLFLPFNDLTNGVETYGGGRYIDLSIPKTDSIVIDFNKAYNPYCTYNKKYSCPIVPSVNALDIRVMAGVKDFKKSKK
jgi:uncharacterized protein (DUF1684 family)